MIKKIFNFQDLSYQGFSLFFSGLISFIINILVFNKTNVNFYAEFSYALSLGFILVILFDFGNKNLILYISSKNSSKYKYDIIYYSIFISLMIFLFISLNFVLFFDSKYFYVILSFFLINISQQISFYLKGHGKFIKEFFWQIYFRSSNLIFVYLAITYKKNDLEYLFLFWSISSLLSIFLYLNKNIKKFFFIKKKIKIFINSYFLNWILPFFIIDIFVTINLRLNIILMKHLGVENYKISSFAAAFRLFEIIVIFIGPVAILTLRHFMKNKIRNGKDLFVLMQQIFLISFGIFLIYFLSSELLSSIFFKQSYVQISNILKYLSICFILMIPNAVLFQYLISKKKHIILMKLIIIVSLICIISNIIFISYYAELGAVSNLILFETLIFFGTSLTIFKNFYEKNRYRY